MIRPDNLQLIYNVFPVGRAEDVGSLRELDFSNPNNEAITVYLLIEAERFWAAAIMQFLAMRKLYESYFHTWGEVTLYYAHFFLMNSILRLSGRAITFQIDKAYRIERTSPVSRAYDIQIAGGGADHRSQWNFYYQLIKQDITDDTLLKDIFESQLSYPHSEREFRQWINYDLSYGFDERHYAADELRDYASSVTSLGPLENLETVLKYSDVSEEIENASVIYIWKHLKFLFEIIAKNTGFVDYWNMQVGKLKYFIESAPLDKSIQDWLLNEFK